MTSLHQQLHRSLNQNKENAVAPSKTPARRGVLGKVGPSTVGPKMLGKGQMMAGPSTVYKDTNVLGKGRGMGMGEKDGKDGTPGQDIAPKRLFTQQIPSTSLKPSKSTSSLSFAPTTTRKVAPSTLLSNTTKTPHTTRVLPTQRTPGGPTTVQQLATTPLPSASRVRRRSRQSFTPVKTTPPGQGGAKSFVTPQRGGSEYGDESFGMEEEGGELGAPGVGISHSVSLEGLVEEEESDGEPEYMPPKVIPLPHDPPFEIPDLKALGKAARQAAFFGRWEEEEGEVMLAPIEMSITEMEQGGYVEGGYVSEIKSKGGFFYPPEAYCGKETGVLMKTRDTEQQEDPIFAYLDAKKSMKSQSNGPTKPTTTSTTRLVGPSSLKKNPSTASLSSPSLKHTPSHSSIASSSTSRLPPSRSGLPPHASALQAAKPRFSGTGLPGIRSTDSAFSLTQRTPGGAGRVGGASSMMMSRGGKMIARPVGSGTISGQRKPLGLVQTPLGNKTNQNLPPPQKKIGGAMSKADLGLGDKVDFVKLEKEVEGMGGADAEDWALDFELGDLDLGRD